MKNICNTRKNGLSPLARGARHSQADPATALRFIPAGAGNTPASSVYSARSPVYPRWRGEHLNRGVIPVKMPGLSPLARGTRIKGEGQPFALRFIPAGAGNTRASTSSGIMIPVYPRWRGEHDPGAAARRSTRGLSPLARGTQCKRAINATSGRFIPAGAGNTRQSPPPVGRPAVYPRWRGEH